MIEIAFPLLLYALGVILLLPAKAVEPRFVAWSAFAWGALACMVSALLALILPFPYSPWTVLATLALVVAVRFVSFRRQLRRPAAQAVKELWLPAALFAVVVSIPTLLQVVHVLPDSFDMLIMARDLSDGEPSPATLEMLGFYGPAWPLLQTPAPWFGLGAYTSLPAAITFTLVATLRYFCLEGLRRLGWAARSSAQLANLVTLLFVSTLWVFFQFTYFHNGSLAALFFLLGIGVLWLALVDGQRSWLWLGTLALLGLSLTRVETVVFSIAFLVAAVATEGYSPRQWVGPLVPFTAIQLAWYGWLGVVARPDTDYLSPPRIFLFGGLVVAFFMAVSLRVNYVHRVLAPSLNKLMFTALGLMILVLIVAQPEQLVSSLRTVIGNFFLVGTLWWGIIWWLVAAAFLMLARTPHIPYQSLFSDVIIIFLGLYLMLGIVAGDYAVRADSTESRVALHILPVILLYLTLRAAPYLAKDSGR